MLYGRMDDITYDIMAAYRWEVDAGYEDITLLPFNDATEDFLYDV
jgi:hypothetical protein